MNPTTIKTEGLALVAPLSDRVTALAVTSPESYEDASRLLADVRSARAKWDAKVTPGIDKIREGLDVFYALRRDVDRPLEAMETGIKEEMRGYDLRQLAAKREAEQAVAQAKRVAEAALAKELAAKTAQMRQKLAAARELAETKAADIAEAMPTLTKASASTRRVVKKWRVVDFPAFLAACAGFSASDMSSLGEGRQPPPGMLVVDVSAINLIFKQQPDVVAAWPGIEIWEDVVVGGK